MQIGRIGFCKDEARGYAIAGLVISLIMGALYLLPVIFRI